MDCKMSIDKRFRSGFILVGILIVIGIAVSCSNDGSFTCGDYVSGLGPGPGLPISEIEWLGSGKLPDKSLYGDLHWRYAEVDARKADPASEPGTKVEVWAFYDEHSCSWRSSWPAEYGRRPNF